MKKGMVKKIALYLAVFQLFSSGTIAKADNTDTKPRKTCYVLVDDTNENNPIYKLYNKDIDTYTTISISDERNIPLEQYGANQEDFSNRYITLIRDPIIWDELQKYWPWQLFDSKYEANLFYQFYFQTICEDGCGYAAAIDAIFHLFEGREKEFYETFGFPMYTITSFNCAIDFNYEQLMLKYFNYHMDVTERKYSIKNDVLLKVYEYELKEYENNPNGSFDKEHIAHARKKLQKMERNEESYGLIPDKKTFGGLVDFLKEYGVDIKVTTSNKLKNAEIGDIIYSYNFVLSEIHSDGLVDTKYPGPFGHCMYVTGFTDDHKLIVSSWGTKYILKSAKDITVVKVKNIKNKTLSK